MDKLFCVTAGGGLPDLSGVVFMALLEVTNSLGEFLSLSDNCPIVFIRGMVGSGARVDWLFDFSEPADWLAADWLAAEPRLEIEALRCSSTTPLRNLPFIAMVPKLKQLIERKDQHLHLQVYMIN